MILPSIQGVPSARRLGWVDINFECSTVCLILPGLVGIWQKHLGKMVEHPNQSQPTQVNERMGHPVVDLICLTATAPAYQVDGGDGSDDVEGYPVVLGEHRQLVGPDLVGGVAVPRDTVGAHDHGVHPVVVHGRITTFADMKNDSPIKN